jgi:4-hydroxy-tetrahydrodipicolinate synthase
MDASGIVVPMATPTRDERYVVDTESLEEFTRHLVAAGVDGLFPGSSIGEFPSLTTEQNRQVVATVAEAAGEDTTVLAGCCDTSVDTVVGNIAAAADAGADAAVVVSPYYLGTTQPGLERFFRDIADDSPLPVLLYNIPPLTGNKLGVDLVSSLATHERIVGLKDTSGDLTYHHRVVTQTPPEFLVFQGATELATASLDFGTDGLIAGPANVFPAAMVRLYEAYEGGDLETARRLMRTVVLPFVNATSDIPTATATKHLVGLAHLDIGGPLPPLPELSRGDRRRLSEWDNEIATSDDTDTAQQ